MVEFLYTRRWEKINKTDFYWGVVKVYADNVRHGGIWNILTVEVLKPFELKIYKDFEVYQVFMHNFHAKFI